MYFVGASSTTYQGPSWVEVAVWGCQIRWIRRVCWTSSNLNSWTAAIDTVDLRACSFFSDSADLQFSLTRNKNTTKAREVNSQTLISVQSNFKFLPWTRGQCIINTSSSRTHRCNLYFSSQLTLLLKAWFCQPQAICCFTARQLMKMSDNCWAGTLTKCGGGELVWQYHLSLQLKSCMSGLQVVSCNIWGREQFGKLPTGLSVWNPEFTAAYDSQTFYLQDKNLWNET